MSDTWAAQRDRIAQRYIEREEAQRAAEAAAARVRGPVRRDFGPSTGDRLEGVQARGYESVPQMIESVHGAVTGVGDPLMKAVLVPEEPWEIAASAMRPIAVAGKALGAGARAIRGAQAGTLAGGIGVSGDEAEAGRVKITQAMMDLANKTAKDPIAPGELRASTRFPTLADRPENPLRQHLSIGTDEMRTTPGFEHNAALLSTYPGFARLRGASPEEAVKGYVDQTAGNLGYVYERAPKVMRERSPVWYEGANRVARALADRWGLPPQSSAGAIATLSPLTDWNVNASLAERAGDILTSAAAGRKATPEMRDLAAKVGVGTNKVTDERVKDLLSKSLDELTDPLDQAIWIKMYNLAHLPRSHRAITPEGEFGDYVRTQSGEPVKTNFGIVGDLAKAVGMLRSGGDMDVISPLLGTKHKVRSFYNNIILPHDARYGDITGDTHHVAAGQLRPLSAKAPAVGHHLGSGVEAGGVNALSSDVMGVQGTYGLLADAGRQFAQRYGLLPRAGQSATWEPVRELFSDKSPIMAANVDDIWRKYDRGEIGLDDARSEIFNLAGGIREPQWARSGVKGIDPRAGSTYR